MVDSEDTLFSNIQRKYGCGFAIATRIKPLIVQLSAETTQRKAAEALLRKFHDNTRNIATASDKQKLFILRVIADYLDAWQATIQPCVHSFEQPPREVSKGGRICVWCGIDEPPNPKPTVFVCPPPGSCKCNCGVGGDVPGICEHIWDGEALRLDKHSWSVTCSRCGMTAMSHDMRCSP